MAIKMRQGPYDDFDPQKMLPGEWAVAIDDDTKKQVIWMCFKPGVVKRMGTYEDFVQQISEATEEIKKYYISALSDTQAQLQSDTETYIQGKVDSDWIPALQTLVDTVKGSEEAAAQSAKESSDSAAAALKSEEAASASADTAASHEAESLKNKTATEEYKTAAAQSEQNATQSSTDAEKWKKLSESYAHGETGERDNEAEDNAKEYARQAAESAKKAAEIAGIDIMTPQKVGIGKPDDVTVKVSDDGTLSVPTATDSIFGISKPDGTSLSVDGGVLSVIFPAVFEQEGEILDNE